ncbi:hypothetical protein JTB14_021357 [Gonioctena quinquepunctata]|nr:hypothetical protein JTB14_021357 [Gonioctena quinquepunctata]
MIKDWPTKLPSKNGKTSEIFETEKPKERKVGNIPQTNFVDITHIKRHILDRNLPFFEGNPSECSKGEARESVMLLISHKNVTEILETLTHLYGRPEFIIKYLQGVEKSSDKISLYKAYVM